ncbi:MAG: DNA mismatch repair protein MutS [Weeksellaceae bacterium]|nr:DNA mismatch repair protein MutS [Weeksellaceae bacterium]
MSKKSIKETPLMKQYNSIKAKYPDALLLFRVGDFYETFGSDAVKASKILDIVLTRRANGKDAYIELAGFPHHSLDNYLPKLVRAGLRVAICDQLEDASQTKSIVKRGVTELVTPGVAIGEEIIGSARNNFLLAVHQDKEQYGIALLDISTGEFLVQQTDIKGARQTVQSYAPKEVLVQKRRHYDFIDPQIAKFQLDDWAFSEGFGHEKLIQHFQTHSLKGFGLDKLPLAQIAAGAIFAYLDETHHTDLRHITTIKKLENDDYIWLDAFTIRNLELFQTAYRDGVSLFQIMDHTVTPMGHRLLRRWMSMPLSHLSSIIKRQNSVEFFLQREELRSSLQSRLAEMADIERICGRIATGKITPRQLVTLATSLVQLKEIINLIAEFVYHKEPIIPLKFNELSDLRELLESKLQADPPHFINKGNVIAVGYSEELDKLRQIRKGGKKYLEEMRERESTQSGIPSLKIDFNNVFGYYIEVRNTHKDKVPEDWQRKQTLVNSERYITPELKEYEEQILGAEDKILQLETQLFEELLQQITPYITQLQDNAHTIAMLDCLVSFAELAQRNGYVKPQVDDEKHIQIINGRHPVIEQQLPPETPFIPNSLSLDDQQQQILMITGPNMSGKSALLRQTALIVLLAHMGSFVPAQSAKIGLVDKIFTRVGASDNISQGESTFMVEMNETAQIVNSLTQRSLIILDEIGRGTSTYDGISIAWALAQHLHEHPFRPKTLFATHYHELNEMAEHFPRIKNYHISIQESKGNILFLRKLEPGGSEHSFGIHVAKIAGMPHPIIQRATELLSQLENNNIDKSNPKKNSGLAANPVQLSFFQLDDPLLESVRDKILHTDINILTPVEALMLLNEIQKMLSNK